MKFFKRAKQDKKKASELFPEAASGEGAAAVQAATVTFRAPVSAPPLDPKTLGFETTAELTAADAPVGQTRALDSVAFGAGIKGPGYNILIVDAAGSGAQAVVRAKLEAIARETQRPADWVYAGYFETGSGYRALELPPGRAKAFADGMAQAIDRLADALPAAFAADDYDLRRRAIEEEFRFSREDALEALRREAEAQNIALLRTPAGIAVAPILEGKVVKADVFNSVPESLRREVHTKIAALEAEIEAILAERPDVEKTRRERLLALNEQIAGRQVRTALDDLMREFGEIAGVERYVKAAGRDLVRNAGLFLGSGGHDSVKVPVGTLGEARFARYRVHVMATAAEGTGAPVVEEANPTYANLFGRIELGGGGNGQQRSGRPHQARRAASRQRRLPAARRARSGGGAGRRGCARARAAGRGDPLRSSGRSRRHRRRRGPRSGAHPASREACRHRQRRGAPRAGEGAPATEASLQGRSGVRRRRRALAGDGRRLRAPHRRHRGPQRAKPVDAGGVALLIDEAARKAGGNGKLSLELGHVTDICREADHWANGAGRKITSAADVERALQDRKERAGASGAGSAA